MSKRYVEIASFTESRATELLQEKYANWHYLGISGRFLRRPRILMGRTPLNSFQVEEKLMHDRRS